MEVETQKELLFYKSILEEATMGLVVLDQHGRVKTINEQAVQMLQIKGPAKEIEGSPFQNHLGSFEILQEKILNCLSENEELIHLERLAYNNQVLTIRGKMIMNNLVLSITTLENLKNIQSGSILSMLEGQEIERKRLSKEIHDGLGPLLSTIKLNLEAFRSEILLQNENSLTHQKLSNIFLLIDTLAQDMRNLSHALMPKVLEDFGLGAALDSLCNHFNHLENVELVYYDGGFDERLEKSIELNLYRIAQELLNNAIKHASASKIILQLIRHPESLVLMVEDNGKGFDKETSSFQHKGIGLNNIKTRTQMLGGTLMIETAPGKGVTASCEIPLKPKKYE